MDLERKSQFDFIRVEWRESMDLSVIQEKVNGFTKDKGITTGVEVRIADLASEVGELAKEVLKGTGYGKKQFSNTEGWENEIGDVLFSLICIANETDTSLEQCIKSALVKYEKRFMQSGHLDSGR